MRNNGSLKWLWLSTLVIVLDQLTKQLAERLLVLHDPVAILPGFNLTLMYNTGAAFSFLAGAGGWQRWFFIGLAVIVSAIILGWLWRLPKDQKWVAAGLALVLGGAIGNVVDRMLFGHVIDFIQVYYREWYWPAFNIADSAITVGVIALLFDGFFLSRKRAQTAS
jgi:signal peptidase II